MNKKYTYLNIVGWLYPYMVNGADFSLEIYYSFPKGSVGFLYINDPKTLKLAQKRLHGETRQADYIVLTGSHLENLLKSMNYFDPETEDYPGLYGE